MMAAVPPSRAGAGSAMNNVSRELGGAFGVAVLGTLLSTRFTSSIASAADGLPASSQAQAETGLAGALEVARSLPGDAGAAFADAARSAFVDGFALAGVGSAVLALAVALGAFLLLPRDPSAPVVDAVAASPEVAGGSGVTTGAGTPTVADGGRAEVGERRAPGLIDVRDAAAPAPALTMTPAAPGQVEVRRGRVGP
jgi:hypothetical protein